MKKFYVHHNYSNDLVWYFFHGTDLKSKDIPAPFFKKQFKTQSLKTFYKEKEIQINFCGEDDWDKQDGFHIFDIHVYLMQNNITKDRGYSYKTIQQLRYKLTPKIKEWSKLHKENLHIFYIDWEGRNHSKEIKKLKGCRFFVDEIVSNKSITNNDYVFTNNLLSYIHASQLDIKHAYFLHQYLQNMNYPHKLSYSVRRVIGKKIEQIEKLLNVPEVHITYSSYSFTPDSVDSEIESEVNDFRNYIESKIKNNYIDKRGYGIHDWGNEENLNNIHEMYYRILPLAEVEIIDEWMGMDYISEKSVIRILSGKTFLPASFKVFDFYNNIQKQYSKTPYPLSFRYESFDEMIELIKQSLSSKTKWNNFKEELKGWVETTRVNLIDICYSNNSYLDIVLNSSKELI